MKVQVVYFLVKLGYRILCETKNAMINYRAEDKKIA